MGLLDFLFVFFGQKLEKKFWDLGWKNPMHVEFRFDGDSYWNSSNKNAFQ